jgi:hypothetical protein
VVYSYREALAAENWSTNYVFAAMVWGSVSET